MVNEREELVEEPENEKVVREEVMVERAVDDEELKEDSVTMENVSKDVETIKDEVKEPEPYIVTAEKRDPSKEIAEEKSAETEEGDKAVDDVEGEKSDLEASVAKEEELPEVTPDELTSNATTSPDQAENLQSTQNSVNEEEDEVKVNEEEVKVSEEEAKVGDEEVKVSDEEAKVGDEEVKTSDEEVPAVIKPFREWSREAEKRQLEEKMKVVAREEVRRREGEEVREGEVEVDPRQGQAQGQVVSQVTVKSNGGSKLTKNFATPDCSAKIVAANPESQGAGNVISHSKDEYFLNKCSDRSWFVVELCESIKALKVQLANFELYSSSPKDIRVSLGNVWPGRAQDWVEFGTFTYRDERTVQTFKCDQGVVGKFAKLEVLSHHGTEHYCPISLFKVFGISEIDLITEDLDGPPVEEEEDEQEADKEPNIMQTIKDAVHKVVNVFRPKNVTLALQANGSALAGASLRHALLPAALEQDRGQVVTYLLATQAPTLVSYTTTGGLRRLLPVLCPALGVPLDLTSSSSSPTASAPPLPWEMLAWVRALHGEELLLALCNLVSVEQGRSEVLRPPREDNSTSTEIQANATQEVEVDKVVKTTKEEDLKKQNATESQPAKPVKAKENEKEKVVEKTVEKPEEAAEVAEDKAAASVTLSNGGGVVASSGVQQQVMQLINPVQNKFQVLI